MVQRIMNSHSIGTTGVTPAQLLFGNAVSLNDRILMKPLGYVESRPLLKVTADMLDMQARCIQRHTEYLKELDTRHLATPYDTSKKVDNFPIGSYVLVEYTDSTLKGRGPPHKLMPFKRGPYKVVSHIGTRYTLLDLITNKHEDVLIHRLHPFNYDEANFDPKEVAGRDLQEYKVEKILNHEGNEQLKSSLTFLVRWNGYDSSFDTWESWKNLRLVDRLHDYLREHGMERHIPKDCLLPQQAEPSRHAKKRVRINERLNSTIEFENDSDQSDSSVLRRSSRLKT